MTHEPRKPGNQQGRHLSLVAATLTILLRLWQLADRLWDWLG